MKTRILSAFIAAVLLFAFAGPANAEEKEPYRIGCVFSITGDAAWLGEPARNTVEMIAEEINENGGINGRQIKLYIEDTQGSNSRAVNAVRKLIKKDDVCAILGPSRSGTSLASVPVVEEAEIPLLSCAAAASITNPPDERRWVFKMGQNDSDAVRRIYGHMKENGINKAGILTGTTGFGDAGRSQLKQLAEEYGIEIAADETYGPGDTDMTAQLMRIRRSDAQAVINWSIVPAQSIVPKNMKQLNMQIPLYQSHGFANTKYVESAGEAAEGCILPAGRIMAADTVPDDHPQKDALVSYKENYESTYNEDVTTFGGHAYDAIWIVAKAIEKAGDNPADIRDAIEEMEFVGISGIFRFSGDDHCGLSKEDFEMMTVRDGKLVVLDQ